MLGKWGKAVYNSLAHKGLFASPHFSQYKRCWGSGGSGVGKCLTPPRARPSLAIPMGKGAFGHPDGHPHLRAVPSAYGSHTTPRPPTGQRGLPLTGHLLATYRPSGETFAPPHWPPDGMGRLCPAPLTYGRHPAPLPRLATYGLRPTWPSGAGGHLHPTSPPLRTGGGKSRPPLPPPTGQLA